MTLGVNEYHFPDGDVIYGSGHKRHKIGDKYYNQLYGYSEEDLKKIKFCGVTFGFSNSRNYHGCTDEQIKELEALFNKAMSS